MHLQAAACSEPEAATEHLQDISCAFFWGKNYRHRNLQSRRLLRDTCQRHQRHERTFIDVLRVGRIDTHIVGPGKHTEWLLLYRPRRTPKGTVAYLPPRA